MIKYKIELKWALIFCVMTLLWMILEKLCGLHGDYIDYQMYVTNLYYIPAIWLYTLALKDKKKNFYGGEMSYLQGLSFGMILSLILALLSPLVQWAITYIITPEYFPNVIKRSIELGYYKSAAEATAYFNFTNYAIQSAIGAFISGALITSIAMIFIRSKKK